MAACVSLFEIYVFKICSVLETTSSKCLKSVRGSGVDRLCKYLILALQDLGIDLDVANFEYLKEIRAAVRIRNALMHASGLLQVCRDRVGIMHIIDNYLYLHESDRRKTIIDDKRHIIHVVPTESGEQIIVGSLYAWRLAFYCRELIQLLCDELATRLVLPT